MFDRDADQMNRLGSTSLLIHAARERADSSWKETSSTAKKTRKILKKKKRKM